MEHPVPEFHPQTRRKPGLREETGLPVVVADDPLTCVARGGGRILELMDELGPGHFGLE